MMVNLKSLYFLNHLTPFQADKLSKVVKASGNTVESYWPTLFAKALEGQNIETLLTNIASAPVAAAAGGAGAPAAAAKEGKIP